MCLKKTLVMVLNGFLMATGATLILVAVICHFEMLEHLDNEKMDLTWIVSALGVAGVIAIIAAILGICGVICCEICCPILVAVILIGLVIVLEIAFLLKSMNAADEFQEYLQKDAKEHMELYGKDHEATVEWDFYHSLGECCGLDSASDWDQVGVDIPSSCCKKSGCDPKNEDERYAGGCNEDVQKSFDNYMTCLKYSAGFLMVIQAVVGVFDIIILIKMTVCPCCKCC